MAAEIIAEGLQQDLCRIDLSQMVSEHIGETERNLRSVLAPTRRVARLPSFDEADALFCQRCEVGHAHDRYPNMDMSYPPKRTETCRGMEILITNLKVALDATFLRRIRFTVHA